MIQTVDKEITHDFSFSLIEAIKYNNWYNNEKIYDYILQDKVWLPTDSNNQPYKEDVEGIIPIGSVEFVLEYLSKYYNIHNVKPVNIPPELMKSEYLKRWVKHWKTIDQTINTGDEPVFIKDNTKIKGFTGIIYHNHGFAKGEWLASEVIDIKSEWRAFVFNNQLVGLQNYQGDFTLFPDVDLINEMICDYKNNPAYTLDVGVNYEKGTFLIEVHDFFSCGLYGFNDYIALPRMFIATWNKLINQNK